MNDLSISKLNEKIVPGLYILSTPIGNLGDLSPRAQHVLKEADIIACEDTRRTGKLLAHYKIKTPTTPYHEHNAYTARPKILQRLSSGDIIALVSDAGTPLLSDPGFKLVREAIDMEIYISGIPGPNAGILALVLSGLPTDRYLFLGFLPPKSNARKIVFEEIKNIRASLIIYESPQRLLALLSDAKNILGLREAAISRELTKKHEEIRRGKLNNLEAHYFEYGPPRGEITLVIGPPDKNVQQLDNNTIDAKLDKLMMNMGARDASIILSSETNLPKRTIYKRAIMRKTTNR